MQLGGSQTPCKKQGENIGYQGRKKCKTTDALFLSDNNGQPLALATPQAGNHNDLFEIQTLFEPVSSLATAGQGSLLCPTHLLCAHQRWRKKPGRLQCQRRPAKERPQRRTGLSLSRFAILAGKNNAFDPREQPGLTTLTLLKCNLL